MNNSFLPERNMSFQFEPLPENGSKFAQEFLDMILDDEEVQLDYSVASIEYIDNFLGDFKEEGLSVNDFAETIFIAGCYVGEVMVRHNGGLWIASEDAGYPAGYEGMPIVIRLPNKHVCDPIVKAFKRFSNGAKDSLLYFQKAVTSIK